MRDLLRRVALAVGLVGFAFQVAASPAMSPAHGGHGMQPPGMHQTHHGPAPDGSAPSHCPSGDGAHLGFCCPCLGCAVLVLRYQAGITPVVAQYAPVPTSTTPEGLLSLRAQRYILPLATAPPFRT